MNGWDDPAEQEQQESPGSQLATILFLFVTLRLAVILFYTAGSPLNSFSDFSFYYQTSRLSQQGYYPFVNMWYEYPPLLAYLPALAYAASGWVVGQGWVPASLEYDLFSRLLGGILLLADAGALVFLHRIARRAWGVERANWTAWVYTGLALPLAMLLYDHQAGVTFLLLLSVDLFVQGKTTRSGAALGLASAAKLLPVFFFAPALRFLWPARREAARFAGAAALAFLLVYLPFLLLGGAEWVGASFRALARTGSYATVWAILDGNWGPGYYGPLATRLQLDQAAVLRANPPVISPWLAAAIFAAVYAGLFFRRLNRASLRQFLWFTTLSLLIFFLWSKGWSPQWARMIFPFLLLSFPNGFGLAAVSALSLVATTHWVDSTGISAFFILSRAALFLFLAAVLARRLWPRVGHRQVFSRKA